MAIVRRIKGSPGQNLPGDVVVYGGEYCIVGNWPGSGTRTLTNLKTGQNEQVIQSAVDPLFKMTGILTLANERKS